MAEESDLEKTESASPRRLERAREEGDVPRSRELATCTILLAGGVGMWLFGGSMLGQVKRTMTASLAFDRAHAFDMELLLTRFFNHVVDVLIAFAPFAGILLVVALSSPLLIGGWLFSAKALQPNFGKMNPLKGLANLISMRSAVELGKAIGKATLIGVVAWFVITKQMDAMLGLSGEPLQEGTSHLARLLLMGFLSMVSALVVIACIDAPYQMWHYAHKLKMTREEVRQEAKEAEGSPEVRARIRSLQREMARRRMMAQVPTADVVVTNPTRYAVAIKYDEGKMNAPRVVAKGVGEVAARIREIAGENHVPMLEAAALARALYRHAELGDEIPEALYIAVAEVFAYVFQLRVFREHGGYRPDVPKEIAVPPHLDPNNAPVAAALAQGDGR